MEAVKIRRAIWEIFYAGTSITKAIAPMVEKIEYSDELHGASDELTLSLNDEAGVWRKDWYPTKGDRLSMRFGLENGPMQPAGTFEIEEIELSFSRDSGATVEIKAVSAGISGSMRSERTQGHEQTSLAQLAKSYADKHKLTVIGDIPDIAFERVTQHRETDLGFLKRIADEHGLCLAVKSDRLLFTDRAALRANPATMALRRCDILEARLKDKSLQTYRAAQVAYSDPATGKTVDVTVQANGVTSGDIHKITERVENEVQARQRAQAALDRLNAGERGGSLKLPGNPALAAGVNITLGSDFGRMAGTYLIEKARHRFSQSQGYIAEIEVKTP